MKLEKTTGELERELEEIALRRRRSNGFFATHEDETRAIEICVELGARRVARNPWNASPV